ncbi:MAG: hydrogenase maturation nickel metallochaperone HypA [Spirochaetes bacterium]|nr:hydrogenase maturation nickel metallochaperone HypA [Spirochaetota bacterium]
MHELSIAEELLNIIYQHAEKAGIGRVHDIHLRVGEYSGIFPDALEFAFEVLSQGKITENAVLDIEKVPPRFGCVKCNYLSDTYGETCEKCGSDEMRTVGGNELEIVSFEGDELNKFKE